MVAFVRVSPVFTVTDLLPSAMPPVTPTVNVASVFGPMNEDTFTVQLMDSSERVHSLEKRTLKSLTHDDRSLMPAYDERRLNTADLDDVLAYLQSLRSATPLPKKDGSQ